MPPEQPVIWKPAKPTMWYQPLLPVPPAVSQMGDGDRDLVVYVIRAIRACNVEDLAIWKSYGLPN
jgi:hypothetical protein